MRFVYRTADTSTLAGLRQAARLKNSGWKIIGPDCFSFSLKRKLPMRRNAYESADDFAERSSEMADRFHDHHSTSELPAPNSAKPMAMISDYLLQLLERCSDQQFGQDAVQFGITVGLIQLTYDRETDLRLIMGEPGRPETGQYDALCEAWRRECAGNNEHLMDSYRESGLLEEILRPVSLAQTSAHELEAA